MRRPRNLEFTGSREAAGLPPSRPDALDRTAPARRRLIRLYLTAILLLSMMLTVYIWQSTKMVEIKFRLKDLDRSTASLQTNNDVLRAEISKLQSLSRVEKVAREQLGMVVPTKMCYLPMPEHLLRK
ncbi:MAG: hypothetical protein OZSIB_2197 [Candidatus Ozemobacter sibiricus]|jgi:cell division protein FtsL|uniref:Cell division protein FtsL n=1 Tax=Candidatus Ozemobacter sibiricus TaxID=2268124 RepID=A0A367ZT67_9BACT|nr:MAG: hypothetical protein OZSIB_2197 [Candidatus Ozemobacter sibiricus]